MLQSLLDFNAASPEVTATVAYPDLVADAELTHDEVLGRRTVAAFCEQFGVEPERTGLTGAHPEGTAKNP